MSSDVRLTTTSYVVLGLVEAGEPATPYDIKQAAEVSVGHFWTVAHTQLYAECTRLAAAGLLDEQREEHGRRRKVYRLTAAGRRVLDAWRAAPAEDLYEFRDPSLVKLFFGADPSALAATQVAAHEARMAGYAELEKLPMTDGMRLALEAGIGHEREFIRFWAELSRRSGS